MIKNEVFFRRTNTDFSLFSKFENENRKMVDITNEIKKNKSYLKKERMYISDWLGKKISEIKDDSQRQKLINYRRHLYNMKESNYKYTDFFDGLSGKKLKRLRNYDECVKKINKLDKSLNDAFNLTKSLEEKDILNLILKENFLNQTYFINPEIPKKLKSFDIKNPRILNKKQRKLSTFLYDYFTRIELKPSPFALLASTGFVSLSDKSNDDLTKKQEKAMVSINRTLLLKIADIVALDQYSKSKFSYQLNQIGVKKNNMYYFTSFVSSGTDRLYKNRQELVKIGSKVLDQELKKDIYSYTTLERKYGTNIIDKLIEAGIFVRNEDLCDYNDITSINNIIQRIESQSELYDAVDVLKEITVVLLKIDRNFKWSTVQQLQEKLCWIKDRFKLDTLKYKELLYIDSMIFKNDVSYDNSTRTIKNSEQSYTKLAEFSNIFDVSVEAKEEAAKILKDNYDGKFIPTSSEEFSEFLREIASQIFIDSDYWLESFGYFDDEKKRNSKIISIKYEVLNYLYNQDNTSDKDIVLEDSFVDKVINDLRSFYGKTHLSRSFFIQFDENKEVINHIYKGYGVYNRRFKKYFDDNFNSDEYLKEGYILDIPMSFGFNANIRQKEKRTFSLPIGEKMYVGKQDLDWKDIIFTLSKESNEISIVSKKTGELVYPHFLGSLITRALPSMIALFNVLTLNDSIYLDFGDVLLRHRLKKNSNDIHTIPRVCFINEQTILSRKKIYFESKRILDEMNDEMSEAQQQQFLLEFLNNISWETQFYVKSFFISYVKNSNKLKQKPLYINLKTVLGFERFMKILKKEESILLEEVVPLNPEEGMDNFVEYIVETNDER